MIRLDDKSRSAKESVLQEILDMMDSRSGSKLKDLKKPAMTELSVTALKPKDGDEMPMDGDAGGDEPDADDVLGGAAGAGEPSEEEKAKIAELYHRYCK